jgi:hypothetical protein
MALYIVTSPNGIIDQDDSLPFDVIADRELPDGWETLIETQMLPAALAAAIDQQHGHGLRDARPGLFANEEGGGVIVHADGTWSDVQTTHMVATVGYDERTYLVTIAWPINGGIRTYYLTTFDPLSPTT